MCLPLSQVQVVLSLQGNLSLWQVGTPALLMNIRERARACCLGRPRRCAPSRASIRRAGRAEPNEEQLGTHTDRDCHRGALSRLYGDPNEDPAQTGTPKAFLTVRNPTRQDFYQLLVSPSTSPKALRARENEELRATF